MADAVGNVISAPGVTAGTPYTTDVELLAATGSGWNQDGVTLRVGDGVLAVGTPLARHEDGTYGPVGDASTTSNRALGNVTFTDTGDLVGFTTPHGLSVGDKVKVGTVTTTTGITAGTEYFVKTVPDATHVTLSTTLGGSTLALTTDGSAVNAVETTEHATTAAEVSGFLRLQVDTGVTGDIPKLGNRVYRGVLKYSVIKAANGGVDLTTPTLTALGARVDVATDRLIF